MEAVILKITLVMKAAKYIYIRRCIDNSFQGVRLIKQKSPEMLKLTANYKWISHLQKYVKV